MIRMHGADWYTRIDYTTVPMCREMQTLASCNSSVRSKKPGVENKQC